MALAGVAVLWPRPPPHKVLDLVVQVVVTSLALEAKPRHIIKVLANRPRGNSEVPPRIPRGTDQLPPARLAQFHILGLGRDRHRSPLVCRGDGVVAEHRFGFGDEWTATRVEGTANWPTQAAEWGIEGGAKIKSVQLTKMPAEADGKLDAVLFIRALHNLNRFTDADTPYMTDTLAETYRVLKPGGIVGVVQHSAPDANSDEWANGGNGYLKKSAVVAAFESAGFELVDSSDINANPNDVPTEEEFVWRLPPTLAGTEEDTPERAAYQAVGESNRMTLKFRKPA